MEEALTTLLASVAGGRRYWGRAPQTAARPFIVLTKITGLRDYQMSGPSGYVQNRVQCDCYGATYTEAKAAARALITAVSGHSGGVIQGIFVDSERDLPTADAGDVNHLFRTSVDLMIHTGE
jgi:phage protein D